MPKVSVIIPVWNQEELIIKCLDSIPIRDDIEVIVVNDGSTDNTENVVLGYHRLQNFKYMYQPNGGPGIARDAGVELATGEFIYFLDSDDYLITDNWVKIIDSDLLENYDVIKGYSLYPNGDEGGPGVVLNNAFIRRQLASQIKHTNEMAGEDCLYAERFYKKFNPKEVVVKTTFFFYNFPRGGSLTWNARHK